MGFLPKISKKAILPIIFLSILAKSATSQEYTIGEQVTNPKKFYQEFHEPSFTAITEEYPEGELTDISGKVIGTPFVDGAQSYEFFNGMYNFVAYDVDGDDAVDVITNTDFRTINFFKHEDGNLTKDLNVKFFMDSVSYATLCSYINTGVDEALDVAKDLGYVHLDYKTFTYDEEDRIVGMTDDRISNVGEKNFERSVRTFVYTDDGRVKEAKEEVFSDSDSYTITYTLDSENDSYETEMKPR